MVIRIVESYKPSKEYPTTDKATYLRYRCNYCLKKFHLVEPNNHVSGGAIMTYDPVFELDTESDDDSKMTGRIVETYKPSKEYPTTDIATYLQFRCNYCLKKFYLVDPDSHVSGGAIQKEVLARDIATREISKVGRMFPACMRCIREAIWQEKNKDFLLH